MASENAFSLGSQVVDPSRASLTPKTVESLVLTFDWLDASPINFILYEDPIEDALKIYYDLEELEKGKFLSILFLGSVSFLIVEYFFVIVFPC